MKNVILLLMMIISFVSLSQEKLTPKVDTKLKLKTFVFDMIKSDYDTNTTYYEYKFFEGYEYPNIREGFYSVKIFTSIDGIKTFYKELENITKSDDGQYKLSLRLSSSNSLYSNYNIIAEKKGTNIKLLTSDSKYAKVLKRLTATTILQDYETINK